jgi:hypothetical protein
MEIASINTEKQVAGGVQREFLRLLSTVEIKLIKIPTHLFEMIGINPPARTNPRKIKKIARLIEKSKFITPVISIYDEEKNKYLVLDGNTRYVAARQLGVDYMYSNVIEKYFCTKEELFIALNEAVAKFDGKQQLYLMRYEGVYFTESNKRKYGFLLSIGGVDLIDMMIENSQNVTNIYTYLVKARDYLKKFSADDVSRIANWLVENKQSYQARKAIEAGISRELWWDVVKKNKPLQETIFRR